jgi:hypothetical protein
MLAVLMLAVAVLTAILAVMAVVLLTAGAAAALMAEWQPCFQ